MVWLKLSDDYGDDCARVRLTDAAFRTHTEGLLWVMRRETGGYLDARDIRRFAETDDPETAVKELLEVGWWEDDSTGRIRILRHMDDQPEPDLIEARRRSTVERVRRHRRKKAGLDDSEPVTPLRDALPGSGRGGTGLETTNYRNDKKEKENDDAWPEVAEPGSAAYPIFERMKKEA